MRKSILIALGAVAMASSLAAAPVAADNNDSPRTCAARVKGLYGFQCHGSSFVPGVGFGPVTFVGTVEGQDNGIYDGHGTFSSGAGSFSTHVAGPATFGRNCFGHVNYTTNDIVVSGSDDTVVAHLDPVSFDFIGVDGGDEILGTAVAPLGIAGDAVPRLTCRLVRVH